MRTFILRARTARTHPGFDINNLPKEGKLDVVCQTIANAIWVSDDVRRDVIIHAVLEGPFYGPKTITFRGSNVKGLRHDERSIATYIKMALQKGRYLELNEEEIARPGISVAKKSFERLVWEYAEHAQHRPDMQFYVLDEKGTDVRTVQFTKNPIFILGDPQGLPEKTQKAMTQLKVQRVSLGPQALFAAHCPVIVNNELDRRK